MSDVILNESGIQQLTEVESVMTRLEPYMELTVDSPEDTKGVKRVHAARMDVRAVRTGLEKSRKALKAEALEFGRKVDSEAKRIKALIEPIETHLIEQENIVKREEERKKKEKEEAEKKLIKDRLNALAAVGSSLHPTAALAMPEGEFEMLLAKVTGEFNAIQEAKEAERKQIEEAKAEIEKQRQELEAERLEKERLAAEAEAEAIRKESLSDKEKIKDYLNSLASVGAPAVVSKEANDLILELRDTLNDWAKRVAKLGAK